MGIRPKISPLYRESADEYMSGGLRESISEVMPSSVSQFTRIHATALPNHEELIQAVLGSEDSSLLSNG